MKLVYVFDAYCGWSYGFTPTLDELVRRRPGLEVDVVSGGLFTGARRVPIREFGYVQGANAKITELTGVAFGPGYERLIADGSFVMDSEDAARGMAAVRQVVPGHAVDLAATLQHAFYVDGLSLSDPATYRTVAAAQEDFARAGGLGVHSFPTLLAVDGDRQKVIAVGHATADQVDRRLDAFAAG
jgi:putative protein-disulfide isomerase